MICTIGSLVKGTTNRRRWLLAISLYIAACSATSVLLGVFLSAGGYELRRLAHALFTPGLLSVLSPLLMVVVSVVIIAYALSDLGIIPLPRPRVMHEVPLNWWRWWQPYGGALAYGAALGLGLTTEIYFSAFYAICLWCLARGDLIYGAFLMGTYGFIRALTLVPATRVIYNDRRDVRWGIHHLLHLQETARLILVLMLVLFAACLLGLLLSS